MTRPWHGCLLAAVVTTVLVSTAWAQTGSVCIDAGHGGHDPGAVGNGLYEDDLNLETALAFRDWLDLDTADTGGGGSWDVYMTRDTDVYVSLSGRCDYANSNGVDVFMCIHTNAGGGNGTETYAYTSGGSADTLAHRVQEEVLDHLGTYDRGVKYASFTVLTDTNMPADLAEMAFIDVWTGNAELLADPDNLDAVGLGHLHAAQRYFGLSAYTPGESPTEPTATVTISGYPSSAEVGENIVISVDYSTNLHELGERGFLAVSMTDADTWIVLDEVVWDNGGAGIQGPAGDHDFTFVAPSGSPSVYFTAYLSPLGGDWTDRYDDDSTQGDPTSIGGAGDDDDDDAADDDDDAVDDDDDGNPPPPLGTLDVVEDDGCSGCSTSSNSRAGAVMLALVGLSLVGRRRRR
jgi:N-acetylmuramoyl-L-alanine amidase